jgi:hypothetical protein
MPLAVRSRVELSDGGVQMGMEPSRRSSPMIRVNRSSRSATRSTCRSRWLRTEALRSALLWRVCGTSVVRHRKTPRGFDSPSNYCRSPIFWSPPPTLLDLTCGLHEDQAMDVAIGRVVEFARISSCTATDSFPTPRPRPFSLADRRRTVGRSPAKGRLGTYDETGRDWEPPDAPPHQRNGTCLDPA